MLHLGEKMDTFGQLLKGISSLNCLLHLVWEVKPCLAQNWERKSRNGPPREEDADTATYPKTDKQAGPRGFTAEF